MKGIGKFFWWIGTKLYNLFAWLTSCNCKEYFEFIFGFSEEDLNITTLIFTLPEFDTWVGVIAVILNVFLLPGIGTLFMGLTADRLSRTQVMIGTL